MLEESTTNLSPSKYMDGGFGGKASKSQAKCPMEKGTDASKEMFTILAQSADGKCGEEHQYPQHSVCIMPPPMVEYLAPPTIQPELVGHSFPYLHESRHLHAVRRARGCGGRFLNTKNLDNDNANNAPDKVDNFSETISKPPMNSLRSSFVPAYGSKNTNPSTGNVVIEPRLHKQISQQAYTSANGSGCYQYFLSR